MNAKRFLSAVFSAMLAVLILGCGQKPDVAAMACSDYDKLTDPVQKAELQKRCPRVGGEPFKPSPQKSW